MGSITSLEFGLLYSKQTGILSKIISISSILKMVISYLLIKTYGLQGAAYSACLLAIVQAILVTVYSQRAFRVDLEYKKITFISISALSLAFLVKHVPYTNFLPALFLKKSLFPLFTEFLQSTAVGEWKSGKIVDIFKMKQDNIIELVFNTILSLLFLVIIPLLWRQRFTQRFTTRWQVYKNV